VPGGAGRFSLARNWGGVREGPSPPGQIGLVRPVELVTEPVPKTRDREPEPYPPNCSIRALATSAFSPIGAISMYFLNSAMAPSISLRPIIVMPSW
jgi:hypothetical protein